MHKNALKGSCPACMSARLFDKLLTPERVAEILGKAPQTVRNMIARGEIKAIKIGRTNRIRPETLDRWLKSNPLAGSRG